MKAAASSNSPVPAERAPITPLPPVFPFAWAVAHGQDRHGLWQAFEIGGVRQRLRWLPPGPFMMGSPDNEPERGKNEPLHPVVLTQGFWIGDTAVTQALWLAVLGGDNPAQFQDDPRCPVERVSFDDITQRLLPALNQRLPGLAARLPWEAEWEYACREAGRALGPFSFGQGIGTDQANFNGNFPYAKAKKGVYRERTVPVDHFEPNAVGLWNMHGNVWEWCQDAFGELEEGVEAPDPHGPAEAGAAAMRVLRGGSWFYDAHYCRSAQRIANDPGSRYDVIGFRLARGPLPEAGWAEPTSRAGPAGEPEARRSGGGAPEPAAR